MNNYILLYYYYINYAELQIDVDFCDYSEISEYLLYFKHAYDIFYNIHE